MVKLTVTETGELLGTFDSFADANEFHDVWIEQFDGEAPACTFEYIRKKSHYDWLHENLDAFTKSLGLPYEYGGYISAHGDKCYSYERRWKDAGIHFFHGAAIFLISYIRPYSEEVRETKNGWVPVETWVVENYERFKPHLPPIVENHQP